MLLVYKQQTTCRKTELLQLIQISISSQGRREKSPGPGQNFLRGPHDVIFFKLQKLACESAIYIT